jgi:flagellar motor switch/type III secretory pathway protein FliN
MNSSCFTEAPETDAEKVMFPQVSRMSAASVDPGNRLCAAAGKFQAGVLKTENLEWKCVRADKRIIGKACEAVMDVSVNGIKVSVIISSMPAITPPSCLSARDVRELALPLRFAIIESILEPVLSSISKHAGVNTVISVSDRGLEDIPSGSEVFRFECSAKDGQNITAGFIITGSEGAELLAGIAESVIETEEESWDSLSVPVSICCGHVILSFIETASLNCGDIILLNNQLKYEVYAGCNMEMFWPASVENSLVILQGEIMETEIESEEDYANIDSLDMLKVRLTFETGRITMTMEELRQLANGSVIGVPGSDPLAVTICVNGYAAGRGRIVDIGGKPGVRIDSIVPPNAPKKENLPDE